MNDYRPKDVLLPPLGGAVLYERPSGDGAGLEFPAPGADNPLLDGERICGLMLLAQRRCRVERPGDVSIDNVEVRLLPPPPRLPILHSQLPLPHVPVNWHLNR